MGHDFTAVMSHTLTSNEARDLSRRLHPKQAPALAAAAQHLVELMRSTDFQVQDIDTSLTWELDELSYGYETQEWKDDAFLYFRGAGGTTIDVERHKITIWNMTDWCTFLTDMLFQQAFRRLSYEFARIFTSPRVIYISNHDYLHAEDSPTLETDLEHLMEKYGAPAASISAIFRTTEGETENGMGFYVDDFTDLSAQS